MKLAKRLILTAAIAAVLLAVWTSTALAQPWISTRAFESSTQYSGSTGWLMVASPNPQISFQIGNTGGKTPAKLYWRGPDSYIYGGFGIAGYSYDSGTGIYSWTPFNPASNPSASDTHFDPNTKAGFDAYLAASAILIEYQDASREDLAVGAPPTGELAITSVDPDPIQPGDRITVTGTGFGGAQGSTTFRWKSQRTGQYIANAGAKQSWADTEIVWIVDASFPADSYALEIETADNRLASYPITVTTQEGGFLGGIIDGIQGLPDAFKAGIAELFVPEQDWSTIHDTAAIQFEDKFPFSLLGKVADMQADDWFNDDPDASSTWQVPYKVGAENTIPLENPMATGDFNMIRAALSGALWIMFLFGIWRRFAPKLTT